MTKAKPKKCFVISPIGSVGSATRLAADFFLKGIVRESLKSADFSIEAKRADEFNSPSLITSSVINAILDSDFIIADLSELNPNVFYELGIAHANEKPIIHCANEKTSIPFDNKDYNTIFYNIYDWSSIESTRLQILSHIRCIFSEGYAVSNPITHALGHRRIQNSADPKDKIVSEISERLSRIEQHMSTTKTVKSEIEDNLYKLKNSMIEGNLSVDLMHELKFYIYSLAITHGMKFDYDKSHNLAKKYSDELDESSIVDLLSGRNPRVALLIVNDLKDMDV